MNQEFKEYLVKLKEWNNTVQQLKKKIAELEQLRQAPHKIFTQHVYDKNNNYHIVVKYGDHNDDNMTFCFEKHFANNDDWCGTSYTVPRSMVGDLIKALEIFKDD